MTKGVKIALVIAFIIVLVGGVLVVLGGSTSDKDSGSDTNTTSQSRENDTQQTPEATEDTDETVAATITYTANGFEPENTTVKSGDKVRIVNESGEALEFSSDPHPSHTINSELNAGDTEDGQSTTITVTRTGEWGYHNHYNASHRGTLIVE